MIMKTIRFSNKPWRYERCIIMEEDLDMVRDDLVQFKNKPRIPHRVVMNNQTFSVFENFDYNTVQHVIPLKYLKVRNSEHDDCIYIGEKGTKWEKEFCVIQMY